MRFFTENGRYAFLSLFGGIGATYDVHLRLTGHRAIIATQDVSEFGYLAAFSNAGGSKLNNVENDAKFFTF